MNVLMILPGGVDASGETEVIPSTLWLIERIAAKHRLTVIALNQYEDRREYQLLGAHIINLGYRRKHPFSSLYQQRLHSILSTCRDIRPDVVHALWLGESGALGADVSRKLDIPLVATLGGGECTWLPELQFGGAGKRRERNRTRKAVQAASVVTAGSHYALSDLPCFGQWLPFGVPKDRFKTAISRPQGPPWRFLHVGSFNPVKNQGLLVDVLRAIRARGFHFHMDWIGHDINDRRLERKVAQLGMADNISFHGWVPNELLPRFYRQAHLYLQTSLYEAQGIAQLEACAAGVPTLGTPVGLVPELSPSSAIAVDRATPEDFADAIEYVLLDPEKRASLARHAQQFARDHDADWTADRFCKLYEQSISKELRPIGRRDEAVYSRHRKKQGAARTSLAMLGKADLEEGQTVLSIGCSEENTLARLGSLDGLSITGVDTNTTHLELAHRRLTALGLRQDVRLIQLDGPHLPFSSNQFDRVLVCGFLSQQEKAQLSTALSEISRVIKPGGRAVLLEQMWRSETAGQTIANLNRFLQAQLQRNYAPDDLTETSHWKDLFIEHGFRLVSSADVSGLILQSPKSSIYSPRLEASLDYLDRLDYVRNRFRFSRKSRQKKWDKAFAETSQHLDSKLFLLERTLS